MLSAPFGFRLRDECPACGSSNATTRYRCRFDHPPISTYLADTYGIDPAILSRGEYRLNQCGGCGTIFQTEVGDYGLLSTLYSDWVFRIDDPQVDPRYAYDVANPARSRDGHEVLVAAEFLGLSLSEMETLDFGMGWASWARIAASLGCRSHGADIAPERMAFAQKYGVIALTDDEIGLRRFHFINLEQVLEHVAHPSSAVGRLAQSLHPGGIMKISVPSQHGVNALLGRLNRGQKSLTYEEIMPVHPLEHLTNFSVEGLAALGKRFGLAPVKPGPIQRFAFLKTKGSLDWKDPRRLAKELIRPWYQFHNPKNHYVWFRRER